MINEISFIQSNGVKKSINECRKKIIGLSSSRGFISARLYKVVETIKNVDYDLVSVLSFDNHLAYKISIKEGVSILDKHAISFNSIYTTICNAYLSLGKKDEEKNSNIFMINPLEVTNDQVSAVIEIWDKAKIYMLNRPGFINATFYKAISSDNKYKFINIARWESRENFMSALKDEQYENLRNQSQQYLLHPSLAKEIYAGFSTLL